MNKLADFWQAHLDVDKQIVWPNGQADSDALARTFFGLGFIEALDSSLKRADDFLDNPTSADESLRGSASRTAADRAYRDCFTLLTADQKDIVRKLIRSSVLGALFSSLVRIDQLPRGQFAIYLDDQRNDGTEIRARVFQVNENRSLDLHDELYDWIWDFSNFARELMTNVPNEFGGFTRQFTIG